MIKKGKRVGTRQTRKSDPLVISNFVEELSWLLDSYKDLDFKSIPHVRDEIAHSKEANINHVAFTQSNDVTKNLVGSLPGLLSDNKLFPTNENIAEFSSTTLGIEIPRWNKKSRNELIGHIVCNTESANKKSLSKVVKALDNLSGGTPAKRKQVEDFVQSGRSWNEVIQSLLAD